MPRDPYEVLGLSKSASADEIKKAYQKLSKKHHPDRNPGDKQAEATYKEVQSAYEVLSDPAKKEQYDTYGTTGPMPGSPGGFGAEGMDPRMAEELFRQFTGGGGGADFSELFGGRRTKSRGRGRTAPPREDETTIGLDVVAQGGNISLNAGGKRIDVKIPAGINDGQKLRVPASATGSGDVILKVNVAPHAYFRREGNDLFLDVPLGLAEAVLGATVEVPTVDGARLDVKVPPGTSSGAKLRLRGKGLAGGDLFLVFQVKVPSGTPDDETRKLIEQYAAKNPQSPRANVPWA